MPLKLCFRARAALFVPAALALILFGSGREVFASGQAAPQPPPASPEPQIPVSTSTDSGPVVRLSADDAVRMALENNLGIQAERLSPQITTLNVSQARAAYAPVLFSNFLNRNSTQPPSSFITGAGTVLTNESFSQNGGLQQNVQWGGGRYTFSIDGSKVTTSAIDSRYNPQLSSNLTAQYVQPLLRGFKTDNLRQQIETSRNNEVIADIGLRERVTVTTLAVRTAYFDLIGAVEGHKVAVQSLQLAQDSLRNNRTKVEVGTLAPIDIIEAEAEVASNEEAVINAEARIKSVEDRLRSLVLNPTQPDFWTLRLEPTDAPSLTPIAVDVQGAITNALANRTDIARLKKQIDNVDVGVRFAENQRMPGLDVVANYNVIGLAGTQFQFGQGFPPPVVDQSVRSFSSALRRRVRPGFPHLERGIELQLPARHQPGGCGPRVGPPGAPAGRGQPEGSRAPGRDCRPRRGPPGRHQPQARRGHAQGARPRRAPPRGRAEAHDRRTVDHVPAVPGAARPRPPAAAGSQRDDRLQPVGRRLRSDPGRSRERQVERSRKPVNGRTGEPVNEMFSS